MKRSSISYHHFLCCFLWCIASSVAKANNDPFPIGARAVGMGNTGVAQGGIFANFNNQAGLGLVRQFGAGFYGDLRYGVEGMGTQALALALPTAWGTLGINFQNFGIKGYTDQKLGLAFGRLLGEQVAVGIQVDYFRMASVQQTVQRVSFEMGMLFRASKKVCLAAHVFNPIQNNPQTERFVIPTVLTLGVSYQVSDKVMLATEIQKDINFKPMLRVGLEYHIVEPIYLRAGFASNPQLYTFGIGFVLKKNLNIDLASSLHQTLDFSPHLSLSYTFGEAEKD